MHLDMNSCCCCCCCCCCCHCLQYCLLCILCLLLLMLLTLPTSSPTVAQNTPRQNSSHCFCCCCCCCLWHCCCCATTTAAAAAVHPAVGSTAGTLPRPATHPGASVAHGGPDHAMQEHILPLFLLSLMLATGAISLLLLLLLLLHSTSCCWPRRCCRTAATASYSPLSQCLPLLPRTHHAGAPRQATELFHHSWRAGKCAHSAPHLQTAVVDSITAPAAAALLECKL
jgi:hypothetical protein